MREIKFRAWDEKRKEMTIVDNFYWFEEMGVHSAEGEGHFAKYEIMQFTGLHDKNGKEIFEGDIVDKHGVKLLVCFQAPSFIMKKQARNKTWYEFILSPDQCQFEEVIGNIYENPELLKGRS